MSFELAFTLFMIPLLAFLAWHAARALRSGTIPFGAGRFDRREDPAAYWFHVALALLWLAAGAWLVHAFLVGDEPPGSLPHLLVGALLAFWFVRSLRTGVAGIGNLEIDRRRDPGLYARFMIVHALVTLLAIGLGILSLA